MQGKNRVRIVNCLELWPRIFLRSVFTHLKIILHVNCEHSHRERATDACSIGCVVQYWPVDILPML